MISHTPSPIPHGGQNGPDGKCGQIGKTTLMERLDSQTLTSSYCCMSRHWENVSAPTSFQNYISGWTKFQITWNSQPFFTNIKNPKQGPIFYSDVLVERNRKELQGFGGSNYIYPLEIFSIFPFFLGILKKRITIHCKVIVIFC